MTSQDERLRELQFQLDAALYKIKLLQEDLSTANARINEACEEIARWKTEALERRQLMIKDQKETLYRLPLGRVR